MINLPSYLHWFRQFDTQRGFTLVEMIVAASIVAILSAVSVAGFAQFNNSQTINLAASGVTTMLTTARSRAQSQVKPDVGSCASSSLEGYGVRICGITGSTCDSPNMVNTYQLHVVCGGEWELLETMTLSKGVSFIGTSSPAVFFRLLSGGVDDAITPKTITVTSSTQTKTISITTVGSITTD